MEEEGNAYTCLDTHTQEFENGSADAKEDRHMCRVVRTLIDTVA